VLAFSETLWLWADAVMDIVGTAHREVELEQAREEQQRRDAFVLALLSGTLDAAELRLQSATFGLDADRSYIPFRARSAGGAAPSRRVAVGLAGDDGLVTGLDRDFAGIAARVPAVVPRVICGLGPPARLEALPASFASASRALQTAVAFGQEGTLTLADLSIRPAILADEALGDAFASARSWTRRCARGSTRRCASRRRRGRCTSIRTRCATGSSGSRRRRARRCATRATSSSCGGRSSIAGWRARIDLPRRAALPSAERGGGVVRPDLRSPMTEHVYKSVEITGSSPTGVTEAIDRAIAKASETLRNLDWFELVGVRGQIGDDGRVAHYQATLKIGFRLED
jgi:flavin-binding protein dodecin